MVTGEFSEWEWDFAMKGILITYIMGRRMCVLVFEEIVMDLHKNANEECLKKFSHPHKNEF